MTTWSGRRVAWSTRFVAVALSLVAISEFAAESAGASTPAIFSFKISGVGNGTLHAGPLGLCLNNGVKSNGLTGVDNLVGTISGFPKGLSGWGLQVEEKKTGTFKITGSYSKDPTVELRPTGFSETDIQWTFWAKSGTVTLKAQSGTISASMSDQNGQKIKISGSWNCPT